MTITNQLFSVIFSLFFLQAHACEDSNKFLFSWDYSQETGNLHYNLLKKDKTSFFVSEKISSYPGYLHVLMNGKDINDSSDSLQEVTSINDKINLYKFKNGYLKEHFHKYSKINISDYNEMVISIKVFEKNNLCYSFHTDRINVNKPHIRFNSYFNSIFNSWE